MESASWSIPALAEEVGGVRHAAVEFARGEGVRDPPLEDLRLAISEAVTNAVVHAFRLQDRPGTVTVTVTLNAFVEAVVRDDGMGMSSRGDSPGLGLGLRLINSVADAVEQRSPANGDGFELWMCFGLDAA